MLLYKPATINTHSHSHTSANATANAMASTPDPDTTSVESPSEITIHSESESESEPPHTTSTSSCTTDGGSQSVVITVSETSTSAIHSEHSTSSLAPSLKSCISNSTTSTTQSKRLRREKSLHNLTRYQRHILRLTNHVRAVVNAPPLRLNPLLNEAARLHNADIALVIGDLSHVSSDGRTLTERLLAQGYDFRYASENLARGQRNCEWVIRSWMKSPGHRRNILNPRVREMGLHVGVGDGKMYWCQVFGIRRGER